MKNGFSTLNRLLGKKKESSTNLSKSSINLSVTNSTTDSSQMHQNRITPLPIATSNAPFEQTFRITVLLPRDQLYVARLGAKVLLHKLLQLVCENKQLDEDKYEFQHPADPSQVFSCDLTIGAVGLSEIRLCNKSEKNSTLHANGFTKLHRTSSERNSFSSSKLSRNSKNISTPSPYSSRNSLSSVNSSGISSSYAQLSAPVVPTRKKRPAPRPPSRNFTPEIEVSLPENDEISSGFPLAKSSDTHQNTEFKVSTMNLNRLESSVIDTNELREKNVSIDWNGNSKRNINNDIICDAENNHSLEINSGNSHKKEDPYYGFDGEVTSNVIRSSNNVDNILNVRQSINQPEPSPRKKLPTNPNKSVPVAPPRAVKTPEIIEEKLAEEIPKPLGCPTPLPRSTTPVNLQEPEPMELLAVTSKNISKTFMNGSPTSEASPPLQITTTSEENFNFQSKQSDSGIEESLNSSWTPSSTQNSQADCKLSFESSSEDEEMINVYDLKLGKTIVKTISDQKALGNLTSLSIDQPKQATEVGSSAKSDISSDTTTLVSPKSLDTIENDPLPDIPITTQRKDNFLLELNTSTLENNSTSPVESSESFKLISSEQNQSISVLEDQLSKQIEDHQIEKKIIETKIADLEEHNKENTAVESKNFIVASTKQEVEAQSERESTSNYTQEITKQKPLISTLERLVDDDELEDEHLPARNIYKKSNSVTSDCSVPKRRLSITRMDSFQLIQQQRGIDTVTQSKNLSGLATRSSSYLSLAQFESENQQSPLTEVNFSRRRSSSELSIGESPSLQSLEEIKSILNSRKGSVTSVCSTEEPQITSTKCDIQLMEQSSPKSNIIITTPTIPTTVVNISKSEEKVYRYSGPPNINFSTWNDRPKVKILIKNEEGSVFDGRKIRSVKTPVQLRNNRDFNSPVPVAEKPINSTDKSELTETDSNKKVGIKPQNSSPAPLVPTKPKFILGTRTSNPWPATQHYQAFGSSSLSQNSGSANFPVLRPTSMTPTNFKPANDQNQPSFGQGTLRKTGFKDKILSPDAIEEPKPIQRNVSNVQNEHKTTKTFISPEISFPKEPPPLKTVPQAPPPPPIIRAVVTKQKADKSQILLSMDPRDQLLSAIRNFKRDNLKNLNDDE